MKYFWWSSCGVGSDSWRAFVFNNTFDMDFSDSKGIHTVCSTGGELIVERNNAFLLAGGLYQTLATSMSRTGNMPATVSDAPVAGSQRTLWFDPGLSGLGTHAGVSNYHARRAGPLDGGGTCDPDGNGVAGVDWNWDGTNDTNWTDIGGDTVSCPTVGTRTHIGAVAPGSGGSVEDTVPPGTPAGLKRADIKP
jgi:hypothetical protein